MEVFCDDNHIVLEIFRFLFGFFADNLLVKNPVLFDQVRGFACVSKDFNSALSQLLVFL